MKKSLLFAFIAAGSLAFGQSNQVEQSAAYSGVREHAEFTTSGSSNFQQPPYRPGSRAAVIDIGQAQNLFTIIAGPRYQVSVRPEINAIAFIHRSNAAVNGDAGSGSMRYDYSTDGGATWTTNYGPTWDGGNGRYPQGGILNDPANTNPANAKYITSFPTLDGSSGSWGGLVVGYSTLGMMDSTNVSYTSDVAAGNFNYISAGQWNSGMKMHHVDPEIDLAVLSDYTDTVNYRTVDLSGATPVITSTDLYVPVLDDAGKAIVDSYIAFDPSGQTGYIVTVGHSPDTTVIPSGGYHLILMKSTDGGSTWSIPQDVAISSLVDEALLDDGSEYTTAFEGDITVDANGDVHFIIAVGPRTTTAYSIGTAPGVWGIFDFHGDETGMVADLMVKPQTFRSADFGGGVTQDSRPQLSVSANGDYVMASWWDSDTLLVGAAENNFPDTYIKGYRVNDGIWLNTENISLGTVADAACFMGVAGDQMIVSNETATMSVVYCSFADPLTETQFHYLDADYSFSGIGVVENEISDLQVYPNPASDLVNIAIELNEASNLSVNVLNMVGQVVLSSDFGMLNGSNRVEMNVNSLPAGMYLVEINAGSSTQTERLIVK